MVREMIYNDVKLKIATNKNELSRIATNIIIDRVKERLNINILLPTGSTPELIYSMMAQTPNLFKEITFFNLDEYIDGDNMISEESPVSFKNYMKEHLFSKIEYKKSYFPDKLNIKSPNSYDHLIESLGGIDLCLLATGEDAHIFGFNFSGSAFNSGTRCVEVNDETRAVNKKITNLETPKKAITTGIATGMKAKEVIFIVSGERKAKILKKILDSKPFEQIPATILKKHDNCIWIIDEDAAKLL